MKLVPIPKLNKALDKALLKYRPFDSEIELFKTELVKLLDHITKNETEEFHKNLVSTFLTNTFYGTSYFINTKGRQDLVIHTGKDNKTKVGVIIEAKRPENKADWFSPDKPNSKALQELILYYLRERIEEKNIDIKYLIATNINEWYIFEASYFDKLFYHNKDFVKQYEEWRDGKKVTKDTGLFYNGIAKPFIDSLIDEIPCTFFDFKEHDKALRSGKAETNNDLKALFKILSPYHLLKAQFANDSNELDDKFYKELLHIIGLEEAKVDSKTIIRRKKENRNTASLLERAIEELKTEGLHKVTDLKSFGETSEEQYFNIALELCITWVNRILFLKLLEGQLINYHKGDQKYRFLNSQTIPNFIELFDLFHKVLAVDIPSRSHGIQTKYKLVPYLNSSLFEISELEDVTIKIKNIESAETLDFIGSTILKEQKKKNEQLKTIEYLFQFLDAYDFASEDTGDSRKDNKTLINASVLGKVFEKINGYKDGSIYTPGFITMYMSRQSIRLAVVQKFNDAYEWICKDFEALKEKVEYAIPEERNKANSIINDLKICDPAVGSGHFLVSALNEIITIKSELKILQDVNSKRLKEYEIDVVNDELIITDEDSEIFIYKPLSPQSQLIQQTIFNEKQTIIENCLFGVDINPNSVKICRLRLWIELLKNAYYKPDGNLETLPNIDINIKCGNSLLSRFDIDADLSKALKSIKHGINAYRGFVNDYKNCKDRELKRGLQLIIDSIKADFRTEIAKNDPLLLKLNKASGELYNLVAQVTMFTDTKTQKENKLKRDKLEADINKWTIEIDEIKNNSIYKNAFEWRFEFPEVLNNNGDFEGFDVIIGNPPYMRIQEIKKTQPRQKITYETVYNVARGSFDLANLFFELAINISKKSSKNAFIFPHKFLNADSSIAFRDYLMEGKYIDKLAHFGANMIFDNADTYTCIVLFSKNENEGINFQKFKFKSNYFELIFDDNQFQFLSYENIKKASELYGSNSWILFDNELGFKVFEKIYKQKSTIESKFDRVFQGIATGKDDLYLFFGENCGDFVNGYFKDDNNPRKIELGILRPFLKGKDVQKYSKLNTGLFILFPYKVDANGNAKIMEEEFIEDNFPNAYLWLKQKENEHRKKDNGSTNDKYWFRYARKQGIDNFEGNKLSSMEICANHPNVTLNFKNFYHTTKVYSWVKKESTKEDYRYFLAIANSNLIWWFLKNTGDTLQGDARTFKTNYLFPFPLPNEVTREQEKPIINLVNQIIELKEFGVNSEKTENHLNQLVYQLYELSPDEIALIESET